MFRASFILRLRFLNCSATSISSLPTLVSDGDAFDSFKLSIRTNPYSTQSLIAFVPEPSALALSAIFARPSWVVASDHLNELRTQIAAICGRPKRVRACLKTIERTANGRSVARTLKQSADGF